MSSPTQVEREHPVDVAVDPRLSRGVKAFLQVLNASGGPPLETLPPLEARAVLANAQAAVPVDLSGCDALSRALAASASGTAPAESGRHAVALPGPEGGGLVANVLPLSWRNGRNPLAALRGGTAVIVQDPAVPAALPLAAFAELYGLTSTEARVLDHLARGQIGRAHV